MVPLSEHEQRILEEIERNLTDDHPLARPERDARRSLTIGALLFAGGFASLIAFFVSGVVVVGVLAFGAMVAAVVLVGSSLRTLFTQHNDAGGRWDRWEQRLRERYKRR